MPSGLYLHIPFCVRKCVYCDFYSIETLAGPISDRLTAPLPDHSQFLDALAIELQHLPAGFHPDTIFIGGGTPTELSDDNLQRLLSLVHRYIDLRLVREWTCESNPGTLTSAKAHLLRAAGVNRMSMGVQSFNPGNLEFLGRIHGPDDVEHSYALLREAGFENINLDMIYGIPGSSLETTRQDVKRLIALGPEHMSCYCLTFEEGTPLMDMKRKGYVREVDGKEELRQYKMIRSLLEAAAYDQYEISNFARPDRMCRHNLLYWGPAPYLGCGPSAHSHWNEQRYANVRTLRVYCKRLLNGESAVDFTEQLPPEEKARESLVMWLRRIHGVPRKAFAAATGFDYHALCGPAIAQLCADGLLDESDGSLRLTTRGLFVSNSVMAELV